MSAANQSKPTMAFFQPKDIYEESRLCLFLTRFVGVLPRKSKLRSFYIVVLLAIYYSLLFSVHEYTVELLDTLALVTPVTAIRKLRYLTNAVLLPVIMISSYRRGPIVERVYEQIDEVDQSLKFLNTRVDHAWCLKREILCISNVTIIATLLNLMDYFALMDYSRNYKYVLMWILDRTPDFVNNVVIVSFAVMIIKITARFKEINRIMETIVQEKQSTAIYGSPDLNNALRWKLLKLTHAKLCKTLVQLNQAYDFQFVILIVMYIVYFIIHVNMAYTWCEDCVYYVDVILSVIWATLDVAKLVYLIRSYSLLIVQHV